MIILTLEYVTKIFKVTSRTIQRQAQNKEFSEEECTKFGSQHQFVREELISYFFKKEILGGE